MTLEHPEETRTSNIKPYIRNVIILLSCVIIITCQVYIQYHRGVFKCTSVTIKYIFTTLILLAIITSLSLLKIYYNNNLSKMMHLHTIPFAFHFLNFGYFIKEHRDTFPILEFHVKKLRKYLFPVNQVNALELSTITVS